MKYEDANERSGLAIVSGQARKMGTAKVDRARGLGDFVDFNERDTGCVADSTDLGGIAPGGERD